jgi:uncharacterized membrane protein YfcA
VIDGSALALVAGAGVLAGAVNAIAGGGTLISFPVLVAVGLPAVLANATNAVALTPGYFAAIVAQRRDLAGQGARARSLLPAAAVGGAVGALLLLATGETAFERAVPLLIAFAAALVALQDRVRAWVRARSPHGRGAWAIAAVGVAAIYGGYFGAGLGVIVIAALGITLDDELARITALKQSVSFVANVVAASVFVATGTVAWAAAGATAAGALIGGYVGGAIASRVPARALRWAIVLLGAVIAVVYIARW